MLNAEQGLPLNEVKVLLIRNAKKEYSAKWAKTLTESSVTGKGRSFSNKRVRNPLDWDESSAFCADKQNISINVLTRSVREIIL